MGYTAVVLEKTSIQLLTYAMKAVTNLVQKGFILKAHDYRLPHHMTINMGEFDLTLNHEGVLASDYAELQIDEIFWSESVGVAAFRVASKISYSDMPSKIVTLNDKDSRAHITAAIKHGVKPFRSNDLFADEPPEDLKSYRFADEMLVVRGEVREV